MGRPRRAVFINASLTNPPLALRPSPPKRGIKNIKSNMTNTKIIPVPPEKRTQNYWGLLNTVVDPEVGVGIVDLGLVYNVDINDGHAVITMTLTSMGCPVGPSIIRQVEDTAKEIAGVEKVTVNLVWDPIWTVDRINPDVRAMLGFGL